MDSNRDSVYQSIMTSIRRGDFPPGSSLREGALAKEIGVSRTPVREALRRLAAEGVVEYHPNRGSKLIEYEPSDVVELYSIRSLLEPEGAALAAVRRSESGLLELDQLILLMDDAVERRDRECMTRLNSDFHSLIVQLSGSRILPDLINRVSRRPVIQRTFDQYSDHELRRSQAHHRELVDAIRRGDSEWARSVMRTHIQAARGHYLEQQQIEDPNEAIRQVDALSNDISISN